MITASQPNDAIPVNTNPVGGSTSIINGGAAVSSPPTNGRTAAPHTNLTTAANTNTVPLPSSHNNNVNGSVPVSAGRGNANMQYPPTVANR
jgi:hypothetical protein